MTHAGLSVALQSTAIKTQDVQGQAVRKSMRLNAPQAPGPVTTLCGLGMTTRAVFADDDATLPVQAASAQLDRSVVDWAASARAIWLSASWCL